MQILPVPLRPVADEVGIGRVRVDPDDDPGPAAVAIGERSSVFGYPHRRPIDGIEVHGRVTGGQHGAVREVHVDGLLGDLVEEVRAPVPLQARRVEAVERALQHREGHRAETDEQR